MPLMIPRSAWIVLGALVLAGCQQGSAPEPDQSAATTTPEADVPAANDVTLTPEEIATIEQLPEPDRSAALAQKVCPISGEHLGTPVMGPPQKVEVQGKTVFLCCEGCKDEFLKDPDAALARLKP